MAGFIGNLVYRISVSAIVGAVVASGVIYLNNQQVESTYKSALVAHDEKQDETNAALTAANAELSAAIASLEAANAQRISDLSAQLDALSAQITAIPPAEPVDYSVILDAVSTASSDISTQISEIELTAPKEEQ